MDGIGCLIRNNVALTTNTCSYCEEIVPGCDRKRCPCDSTAQGSEVLELTSCFEQRVPWESVVRISRDRE